MKLIIAVTSCLLLAGSSFAQNNTGSSTGKGAKIRRTTIGGVVLDARRQPVPKVQAYIYKNDTIMASGYTTADGRYEANSVLPGIYSLRFAYPSSGRRVTVTGVPVKALKVTTVDLRSNEPAADTTITYNELYPKVAPKK